MQCFLSNCIGKICILDSSNWTYSVLNSIERYYWSIRILKYKPITPKYEKNCDPETQNFFSIISQKFQYFSILFKFGINPKNGSGFRISWLTFLGLSDTENLEIWKCGILNFWYFFVLWDPNPYNQTKF